MQQPVSKRCKQTLYLAPGSPEQDVIEVRSAINRALLCVIGKDGVYLWERRSNIRHALSWEKMKQYQGEQEE